MEKVGGRGAFTLVEVLVVISIIVLLLAMLLPGLSAAREAGRSAVCKANLHSVGQLEALYCNAYKGNAAWNLLVGGDDLNSCRRWAILLWNTMNRVPVPSRQDPLLGNVKPVTGGWLRCPASKVPGNTTWADGPAVSNDTTKRYLSGISYTRNSFDPTKVGYHCDFDPFISSLPPIKVERMRSPARVPDVTEGWNCDIPSTTPVYWELKYANDERYCSLITYYHGGRRGANVVLWDGHVEAIQNSFFDKFTMMPKGLW